MDDSRLNEIDRVAKAANDVTTLELVAALREARRERDAYKRAKAENDDRFMTERDEAREEAARWKAIAEARLDISPEEADAVVYATLRVGVEVEDFEGAIRRGMAALRAHAAKAVP